MQWEPRETLTAGRFNVKFVPLADPKNVLLPPLHIKLGLMKCFVRAMDHQGSGFKYLKEKFGSYKSDAKLIAGIFIGPEIRKFFSAENFPKYLNTKELEAWDTFKWVAENFPENHGAENYIDIVGNMIEVFTPRILSREFRSVSDEHGERFTRTLRLWKHATKEKIMLI